MANHSIHEEPTFQMLVAIFQIEKLMVASAAGYSLGRSAQLTTFLQTWRAH